MTVSVASVSQIIVYFLSQTALVFLIACIPGILFGYLGVQAFFTIIAQIMHTTPASLSAQSLIQTFILIGTIFIYVVYFVFAYIYRLKIKDLLATQNAVRLKNLPPERTLPDWIFLIRY
ncbi:MAG: hypothetical protein Q4C49_09565 [Bacillota bacterium]|nr:hypothetical protein [Bacillota bacterium]